MINNLEEILPLLEFTSKDDFYYLQILQRKKENKHIGSNSRVIKNYYIRSKHHLLDRYEEIKQLCNSFNARASLRLNKRSYEKVAFKALEALTDSMMNRVFDYSNKAYDKACGLCHNDPNTKWIIDIDDIGRSSNDILLFIERECDPIGKKFITIIPSKNGYHIITKPFRKDVFIKKFPDISIHKDNPTNLYIP